jgi:hypothetical protein
VDRGLLIRNVHPKPFTFQSVAGMGPEFRSMEGVDDEKNTLALSSVTLGPVALDHERPEVFLAERLFHQR